MNSWRAQLRSSFTQLTALADFLELSEANRAQLLNRPRFPLLLPLRLAQKIAKNTLDDPILLQFVPLLPESIATPGFTSDPVSDGTFRKNTQILHKYSGRALVLATGACAMHCRYCFRQNFSYETPPTFDLTYLRATPTIEEVILSGGDPLSLPDDRLGALLTDIAAIPHVRRIRFHTRFPIGIPERLDAPLLALLAACPKPILFVFHINHPRELDADVIGAIRSLQKLGIPTLNQSVLLRGVNDSEDTLLALSRALLEASIIPYYLHMLDRVQGTAHFEISETRAHELLAHLQAHMSGFGVPKLVREEAGKPSKTVL